MHLTKLSLPLAAMAISRVGAQDDFVDCTDLVGLNAGLDDPEFERMCVERAIGGGNTKFDGLLFNAFSLMNNSFEAGTCPDWRTINAKCNNVANTAWGAAGQTMPRSFPWVGGGDSSSTAGKALVYDPNRWANHGGALGTETDANGNPVLDNNGDPVDCAANNSNDWGSDDPRTISDKVCRESNNSDYDEDHGFWSGNDQVPDDDVQNSKPRSDSVITYAQVMDHELDATGPKAGSATDSGCAYPFGNAATVAGKFKRSNDAADNGITSYVDAGIVYGESDNERMRLRGKSTILGASVDELQYTCLENSANTSVLSNGMHGICAVKAQYLPDSQKICGFNTLGTFACTTQQMFMANPTKRACFYAGDFRANENPALLAYHTLFMRMHNHIYQEHDLTSCSCNSSFQTLGSFDGAANMPGSTLSSSTCNFEIIRHKVGYEEQYITYHEWLPAYTGTWSSDKYYAESTSSGGVLAFWGGGGIGGMYGYLGNGGYQTGIRGEVRHVFATATFRHHTGVNHTMQLVATGGQLELDQTYFESCVWVGNKGPGCESQHDAVLANGSQNPDHTNDSDVTSHGILHLCDILAGQSTQAAKRGDTIMLTEQRNQLFYKVTDFGNTKGDPAVANGESGASGGFEGFGGDLSALNIARGRDHNIAGYKKAFEAYFVGATAPLMAKIHEYDGLGDGYKIDGSKSLAGVYENDDSVDLWVGALAEAKLGNGGAGVSMLGTILTFDVVTQFQDLRDGDRFWYENVENGLTPSGDPYSAPARCDATGLAPGNNKGLAHWVKELTGATGFDDSLNPFQVQTISCDYDGEVKEHTVFTDNRCGSGAKGGNVVYVNVETPSNEAGDNAAQAAAAAAQAAEEAAEAAAAAAQESPEEVVVLAQEAKNPEVAHEHKHKVHKRMH